MGHFHGTKLGFDFIHRHIWGMQMLTDPNNPGQKI